MIQMDLTTATPDDKAACFGEAFRHVRMLNFRTSATGVLLTTVLLNGAPVVLVGDPEEALARRMGKYTAWGARRLLEGTAQSIRKAWAAFMGQKKP